MFNHHNHQHFSCRKYNANHKWTFWKKKNFFFGINTAWLSSIYIGMCFDDYLMIREILSTLNRKKWNAKWQNNFIAVILDLLCHELCGLQSRFEERHYVYGCMDVCLLNHAVTDEPISMKCFIQIDYDLS